MPGNHKIALNGLGRLGLTEAASKLIDASVDTIAQQQEVSSEELLAKAKEQNLPVVYILREQYNEIDPAVILQQENENHCVLIPVDRYEMDRIKADAVPYTAVPPMPILKTPEIFMEPSPYYGGHPGKHGGNKTPKIPPKDYAKKKKAKRRAQKQARRKR